ncbi:MAG TPA: hypothetical protein VJH97_01090 [Candidatus Nanoarchaeia archaeon]|nr:hypothetical protein [Candidatus Nanoarchaeia archaeon]
MAQGFVTFGKPGEQIHSAGLFKHEIPAAPIDYSDDITNLGRRLRVLEERNTNLQNRIGIIEQNMLSRHKQLNAEIKTMLSDMNELKKEINEIKDRTLMFVKELQMSAKKEDMGVLKKYIELWEPANFATHTEVEELIDEAFKKRNL